MCRFGTSFADWNTKGHSSERGVEVVDAEDFDLPTCRCDLIGLGVYLRKSISPCGDVRRNAAKASPTPTAVT